MVREAREEAGIEIAPSYLEVVGAMHFGGEKEYISFFLRASVWPGDVTNMEPDECDDLRWFSMDDLPDNTIPYVRQ